MMYDDDDDDDDDDDYVKIHNNEIQLTISTQPLRSKHFVNRTIASTQ